MTPNDVQIDVLMRRYAKHSGGAASPEHLDADELNAFAEGSLPAVARARYVSHLADCDNCRQMVSQLAMSAGAIAKTEPVGAPEEGRAAWSKRLAAFFAPRSLRYAAFAMVLIAAAGAVFLVTRRPARNSALVAQNETNNQRASSAETAPQTYSDESTGTAANRSGTTAGPAPNPTVTRERDDSRVAAAVPAPKQPEVTSPAATPALAAKSAETMSESRPSYAPPPPGETQGAESRPRQKQSVGGLASGPLKTDASGDKNKAEDRVAAPAIAKDRLAYENNRVAMNQAQQNNSRTTQEKRGGPRRSMDNIAQAGRNEQEQRIETQKKESGATAATARSEEAPETRSVGGRKFRKQGNAWIDLKFKSSMSLRTITRGSDEFSSLDSGLRSIASQLSGEIIVVWKSKAYRIR